MVSLKQEVIGSENAPIIVLFGGSPVRRHEVIELLEPIGDITVYGTLNEAEGMAKLEQLGEAVNLVLIGGRYTLEQRKRIQTWVSEQIPQAKITQPGHDYPYENAAILLHVKSKI